MNYNWKTIFSINRQSNNYYGVYETVVFNIKIRIYVSVTPNINEYNKKRAWFSHVYFETSRDNITDSLFHSVSDDIYFLLNQEIDDRNFVKTSTIEYYCVKQIPNHIAFTSGDYSFDDLK